MLALLTHEPTQESVRIQEESDTCDACPSKPVRPMGLLAPLRGPWVGAWRRAGHDDDVHAAVDPDPNTNANANTDTDADTSPDVRHHLRDGHHLSRVCHRRHHGRRRSRAVEPDGPRLERYVAQL